MKTRALLPGTIAAVATATILAFMGIAHGSEALPGGTLDPLTVPKYVTPLVIPPVMKNSGTNHDYDIAVRQFQQQILPGGHWNALSPRCTDDDGASVCTLPATTVWSYGPDSDPEPDSSGIPGGAAGLAPALNSQFNYPAYTIEAKRNRATTVDWINDLVVDPWNDTNRNFLPHLLAVDRSLHWANPEGLPCTEPGKVKDCRPDPMAMANPRKLLRPYKGPVPIIVHVHGAHVQPESDGYPEAWFLPDADNIPASYSTSGTLVNAFGAGRETNNAPGIASFTYPNDQPSTTLWYHDHALGMTRNNVYAGPAGFWLIRKPNGGENGLAKMDANGYPQILPGPAPQPGETLGDMLTGETPTYGTYREIPIVIQDRAFNADGSLFYPANRAFFEGLGDGQRSGPGANAAAGLVISTIGTTGGRILPSDVAPIWNPEAFFNVMVVNGVSWPNLDVEPDLYRFRLLNGSNSRFLNLAMYVINPDGSLGNEIPFYQIGAEQSTLPRVVKIVRGNRVRLARNKDVNIKLTSAPLPAETEGEETVEGLLMGPAERADVIVDFEGITPGTVVRMVNTAPDAPFGGFPDVAADPATSGQIMEFTVGEDVELDVTERFTHPSALRLSLPDRKDPANVKEALPTTQNLALLEEESQLICARTRPDGTIIQDAFGTPDPLNPGTCIGPFGGLRSSLPFGPQAAVLGTNGSSGGTRQLWSDPIMQNPMVNTTETWEMWNWSADAHPMHLHLVKFKVLNREPFDVVTGALQGPRNPELTELGWKDTVISYPGEVTRVNATFDLEGLYVWHCHIVEHEDNEMMVPYCVGDKETAPGCSAVP